MTVKQRKFVKGKLEGKSDQAAALGANYSPMTARVAGNKIAKHPDVIAAFQRAMKKAGITDELLATRMKEGIDAQETKFFQKDGIVTDSRDVVAFGERRAMLELAARMKNLLPKEQAPNVEPLMIQVVHIAGDMVVHESEPLTVSAIDIE